MKELLLLFATVLVLTKHSESAGNCYRTVAYYTRSSYADSKTVSYPGYTSCGWYGWRRCQTTRYRKVHFTSYRANLHYKSERYCCLGYYNHGGICREKPRINLQPTDIIAEISTSAKFSLRSTGFGFITYQWYHEGRPIKRSGQQRELSFPSIRYRNEGAYYCYICDQNNRCINSNTVYVTITVNAPTVTKQPISQDIDLDTNNYNTTLSCEAKGTNIQYQWERLNANFSTNTYGRTTKVLSFVNVKPENDGKYRCKVFNSSGYGYSRYAGIKVTALPPKIISQPKVTVAAAPFGAHFSCAANGYGNIRIQWEKVGRGPDLPDKVIVSELRSPELVNSTLFIPHVAMSDEGKYYCTAWIGQVFARSHDAALAAIISPDIKVRMSNTTVDLYIKNFNLTMRCNPSNTKLQYSWNRKFDRLPAGAINANTSTLTLINLTPEDAGDYQCMLTNSSGIIASDYKTLTVNVPTPIVIEPPMNASSEAYSNVEFSCTGQGYRIPSIEWTVKNSKVTSKAVTATVHYADRIVSTLSINNTVGIYSGTYCCAVKNEVGSSKLACADLTVNVPCPEVNLSPQINTVLVDEEAKFHCSAFSFGTVGYRWERVNGDMPQKAKTDAYPSTLTIPKSKQDDEDDYCCIASNECGEVKECARLSVIARPTITVQPFGGTMHAGTREFTMNCSAVGHGTITYTWQRFNEEEQSWDDLAVEGQVFMNNTSMYTLQNIQMDVDGLYRCLASNSDGPSSSRNATINVYGPPAIELSSTNITAIEGDRVMIVCTTTNDKKSPFNSQITWISPQGQVIEQSNDFKIMFHEYNEVFISTLTYEPINHTITGVSKCIAKNHPMSHNEMNYTITVNYPPMVRITPSTSPYIVKSGSPFLLLCSAKGRPSPSVQWYKGDQPLTEETASRVQEVTVPRRTSSDSAQYRCVSRNQPGNDTVEKEAIIDFQVVDPRDGPCGRNNGGCDHICTATNGIVKCYCHAGYFRVTFFPTKCIDVDECILDIAQCSNTCVNSPGSYRCECPYGKVLAADGKTCLDCYKEDGQSDYTTVTQPLPANIKEESWHVAVCDKDKNTCSGSLVNDQYIITSAECVCNNTISPSSVSVYTGKRYSCDIDENDAVRYTVSNITCHQRHVKGKTDYNTALLKLRSTVDNPQPICLPSQQDRRTFSANNFAGVYSYGISETSDIRNVEAFLRQITRTASVVNCNISTSSYATTNNLLCTGSNATDCWGKSGAALVTYNSATKLYVLAGMQSKPGDDCTEDDNGVFTKINEIKSWIIGQMSP